MFVRRLQEVEREVIGCILASQSATSSLTKITTESDLTVIPFLQVARAVVTWACLPNRVEAVDHIGRAARQQVQSIQRLKGAKQ